MKKAGLREVQIVVRWTMIIALAGLCMAFDALVMKPSEPYAWLFGLIGLSGFGFWAFIAWGSGAYKGER